jgi:urease accessory protein
MSLEGLDTVVQWIRKYALIEKLDEPKLWR